MRRAAIPTRWWSTTPAAISISLSDDRTALIVGAGIGGLSAAIVLRRAGWDVRVLERADSPRELGFALALAPNALHALREIGVADAVAREGAEVRAFELRRADGVVLKRIRFRSIAAESLSVVTLRPALHGVLLAAVPAASLLLGHDVRGVMLAADRASVMLADGRTLEAAVLVGADGVGSIVRRHLHPSEAPPARSGYQALRGVSRGAAAALDPVDVAVYLGDGIEAGFARASATDVYWYFSLVDELVGEGAGVSELLASCTRGMDPRVAAITQAAGPEDMRLEPLYRRDPIAEWGSGRATLLGDAAHPVLPHTAQGAALAIEDAVALGLALTGARDVPAGLRLYESVRSSRTRQVVRAGPRIAALTTTRSRMRIRLRDLAIRVMPGALLSAVLQLHARDPHARLRKR
jgi:2-polyprenyl-6-methoxyphenol hydroxylase-like FAD-dependent oxidoreductase